MALPHTYNPVFTASGVTPPSSGGEMITIPYAGVSVSSTSNSTDADIVFSNNGSISFFGTSLDAVLPWAAGGAGTNIDSAGWYETKTGTLTASDFEISFTWSPGSFQSVGTFPAMSQNTWYSLGTTRTISFSHFESTSFQRINSGGVTATIRLASNNLELCRKSMTVVTTINAL